VSRVRILIVDDNPDVIESLRMLFESSGFGVAGAISGLAAIQYYNRCPVTVVLVDLGMPHINGFDLMRTLKAAAVAPLLGIAMTGWTRPDDVAAARAAGFDHYFTKPMDTDAIETLIRSFIQNAGSHEIPIRQSMRLVSTVDRISRRTNTPNQTL
jgi:CheY-like chemotaxis protein